MHASGANAFKGNASALHQISFDAVGCANPENVVTSFIQYLGNG